jgi:hypothetical protein
MNRATEMARDSTLDAFQIASELATITVHRAFYCFRYAPLPYPKMKRADEDAVRELRDHLEDRIAGRFQSEFTAVTDVELQPEHNERHRFVREPLRDAGIESLGMSAFAARVPKLKAQMQ